MSITVGVPSAIGAELVLQGKIQERGVLRPIYKDIYVPTLAMLEKAGIKLVEEDEDLWLDWISKIQPFFKIRIILISYYSIGKSNWSDN